MKGSNPGTFIAPYLIFNPCSDKAVIGSLHVILSGGLSMMLMDDPMKHY